MSVWNGYDELNGYIDCSMFLALIRKLKSTKEFANNYAHQIVHITDTKLKKMFE